MSKWVHKISDIDTGNRLAFCVGCDSIVSIVRKKRKGRYGWACKFARKIQRGKKKKARGYGFRSGQCEICEKEVENLVQDHNHSTEKNRGWLCLTCNLKLGTFEKNVKNGFLLYLEKYPE